MLPTDLVDVLVNGACLHRSDVASLRQSSRSLKDKVDQTLTLLRPSCDLSHVRLVPSAFGVLSTFDMSAFDLRCNAGALQQRPTTPGSDNSPGAPLQGQHAPTMHAAVA